MSRSANDDVIQGRCLEQIFGFIHPRDLLNLARTTKAFRSFLMNPSAQPLWKASMARVDNLPTCPTYMTEPQFINLLFFSHCHVSQDALSCNLSLMYRSCRIV